MSNESILRIIEATVSNDPVTVKEAFEDAISSKLHEAIENRRADILAMEETDIDVDAEELDEEVSIEELDEMISEMSDEDLEEFLEEVELTAEIVEQLSEENQERFEFESAE